MRKRVNSFSTQPCWNGCACSSLCSNCWCTGVGGTGSVGADHEIAPVGHDITFTLTTDPGLCANCVLSWSGGGEPATGGDYSWFTTHWDTTGTKTVTVSGCGSTNFSKQVTIFKLDLIVENLSEEQEEDPGKGVIINDDDDNNNGTPDNSETGTVANEDDLVIIGPSITPTLNSGSAMLEAWYQGNVCPIKLWLNQTKGCELPLYQDMAGHSCVTWNLSQETVPTLLYVEGYCAGDVVLDFSCNNVAWYDSVVFHVSPCVQPCDPNTEFCCHGKCCKNWQCCINGNCVDPICDNCLQVVLVTFECYHEPGDVTCDTNRCIVDILESATCEHKGFDWPCNKMHCNAKEPEFPWEPEVVQYVVEGPNVHCPGGPVEFVVWYTLWSGCDFCWPSWQLVSCVTSPDNCNGVQIDPDYRGVRKECGCY